MLSAKAVPPALQSARQLPISTFVVVAILLVLGVSLGRPIFNHWRAQETPLRTARTNVAHLQILLKNRPSADSAVQRIEQQLALEPQRVLRARSRSLAASALQSMVLELAEASNVTITRLDVASADSSGDLPFDLSANGDIYGLADLLQRIRTARFVVVVRKLQVQNNSALRGAPDVLQIALSLEAPVIVQ